MFSQFESEVQIFRKTIGLKIAFLEASSAFEYPVRAELLMI
jgi:hypothetical protein